MVGALTLFIIAVCTLLLGLWMFARPDTDEEAMRGLLLMVISAVTFSAALIIDGLRHYANRLSTQIDWILKPTGVMRGSSSGSATGARGGDTGGRSGIFPSTPAKGADGQELVRYHVVGKDQSTGLETELVVQVANETEALKAGERHGMEVKRVTAAE